MTVSKSIDLTKIAKSVREQYDTAESLVDSAGVNGDNISELNPKFNAQPYEIVYSGKHDANIVLGRDRAGVFNNNGGYGNLGYTSCASIDIVVGRKSADENFNIETDYVDPDFITDAARIYISQRADIDNYFNIPAAKGGISESRSAIGIKADGIRLVARENLKLVVGTDQKNSQGGNISTKLGIDLVAGDLKKANEVMVVEDTAELQILEIEKGGMQPIPLGINTVFAIDQLIEKIDKVCAIISTTAVILTEFMTEMSFHTHRDPVSEYFGVPIFPSEQSIYACTSAAADLAQYTIADIANLRIELINYKNDHLKPPGAYYINSRYHSLN